MGLASFLSELTMINEDQFEQLAIQWFQDTGWSYAHGPAIAPEGVAQQRSDFREVILKDRLASAEKEWAVLEQLQKAGVKAE